MHRDLRFDNTMALTNIFEQLSRKLRALTIEHLSGHNKAAKDVHEQVQIKILPFDGAWQIGEVPGVYLVDNGGLQCKRFMAFLGFALAPATSCFDYDSA